MDAATAAVLAVTVVPPVAASQTALVGPGGHAGKAPGSLADCHSSAAATPSVAVFVTTAVMTVAVAPAVTVAAVAREHGRQAKVGGGLSLQPLRL